MNMNWLRAYCIFGTGINVALTGVALWEHQTGMALTCIACAAYTAITAYKEDSRD